MGTAAQYSTTAAHVNATSAAGRAATASDGRGTAASSPIAPYTAVSFDNHGCIFDSDSATCMGEYYFTGTDSSETKVECVSPGPNTRRWRMGDARHRRRYTFGYKKDAEGNLKIVVHHSSLP